MKWFTAGILLFTSVMHVSGQDSTEVVPAVEVVQISGMVVTGDSLAPWPMPRFSARRICAEP